VTLQTIMATLSSSSANMLLLGGMAAMTILGAWSSYAGTWREITRGQMTFRAPPVSKVSLALTGFWFLAFLPDIYSGSLKSGAWDLSVFVALLVGSVGLLMIWGAGLRRELHLNIESRTYRLVSGWMLKTQTKSGAWEDFTGVFIRPVSLRGGDMFFVGLMWKGRQNHLPHPGQFGKHDKASAFASEMSKVIGVPVVAAPLPEPLRMLSR